MNLISATAISLLFATGAPAQHNGVEYDFNWDISADGDWQLPANWGFNLSFPNATNHNVYIPDNGTYTISITDRIYTNDYNNFNPKATVRLRHREVHFVHGNFHNEGRYIIDDAEIAGSQLLYFEADSTITGSGTIEFRDLYDGSDTGIEVRDGYTITHGPDHTITGIGNIEGSVINQGTIESAIPDHQFLYQLEQSQNTGLLVSTAGQLTLGSGTLLNESDDGTTPGLILADGGTVKLSGGNYTGGILESRNNSPFILRGPTLAHTTLVGEMIAEYDSHATFNYRVTNNAYITVNPEQIDTRSTIILVNEDTTIDGNGTIELHDNKDGGPAYNGGRIHVTSLGTLTIGHQQTILGSGQIFGSIINAGTVNASRAGHELEIHGNPFINNGTLKATNNATLIFDHNSTISQPGHRHILADNAVVQLTDCTVIGGSFESIGTGYFYIEEDSTLEGVIINAPLGIRKQEKLFLPTDLINNNTITVNLEASGGYTPLTIQDDITVSGSGTMILSGPFYYAAIASPGAAFTFTNAIDHTIVGGGQINTHLLNQGTLRIGTPPYFDGGDPVRMLYASAPITMDPTGNLEVGVMGQSTSDLIESTSSFHAAGTLEITYDEGFAPTSAWTATIITAEEGITGQFETINYPPAPSDDERIEFITRYNEHSVQLGWTCTADYDFNAELDFFDIAAFISDYSAQNPGADFNNDNNIDFFDIAEFIGSYSQGCP